MENLEGGEREADRSITAKGEVVGCDTNDEGS